MTIEAAGQNESAARWKCNEHCAGVPRKKEVENAARRTWGDRDAGAPVSPIFRADALGQEQKQERLKKGFCVTHYNTPAGGRKVLFWK